MIRRFLRQWKEKADGTLEGPAISAGEISITNVGTILQRGSFLNFQPIVAIDKPADVTSSSYADVGAMTGYVNQSDMPSGMTLFGRYFALIYNDASGETITSRPRVNDLAGNSVALPELEITQEGGDNTSRSDTGWTKITSVSTDFNGRSIESKVTGGTGIHNNARFGVQFAWGLE
ncbi:hypothetical protein [Haloferax volcanii]|uniref:hypothetical protein n=1 Tax=Haloferax volcanii TaxID=2246 RepID=UPI00249B9802|nr:hypothetical protein [Haloferax alexandrinus]